MRIFRGLATVEEFKGEFSDDCGLHNMSVLAVI